MKNYLSKCICGYALLGVVGLQATMGSAEPTNRLDLGLNRISVNGVKDTAKLKLLAERGYVTAQLKIASECMNNHYYADAVKWYSAAAEQGIEEACYHKGHILLFGCKGTKPEQDVAPKPSEGLPFTYMAATNRNYAACFDMGRATKDGIGCPIDLITAYAWFSVCADAGDTLSHTEMNGLALRLSTADISRALALAHEFKARHWPEMALPSATQQPGAQVAIKLKLSGVVYSPRGNLAVINNRTMGEGETSQFATDSKELISVTCQHIQTDGVEMLVAGEAKPRTLTNEQ
jgi:hypothetical protein